MRNQILERMIAMTKNERYLAEVYANGARTVIKDLEEGKDGFFCREVIERALINQGRSARLDKAFPDAFKELQRYQDIYNSFGLIMILRNFIEMLETE